MRMPQGRIRKGFFFYFGLFVLLIIAIFLIILVVMMFNPGKQILWFQYFTYSDTYEITATTDENTTNFYFNESTFTLGEGTQVNEVKVNCTYADVIIQKTNDTKNGVDCVIIENNAKGFALASEAQEFSYSITLQDNTLYIDIVEPTGFLYLSDSINIKICLAYWVYEQNPTNSFENVSFEISTTSGIIDIGGSTYVGQTVTPKSLIAETTSGDIYLRDSARFEDTSSVSLTTVSGDIEVTGNNVNNETMKGIELNGALTLRTTSGTIDFEYIKANSLTLSCESGNIVIDELNVDNTVTVDYRNGNFVFGDIVCATLSFTKGEDRVDSPNIQISSLTGNLIFSTSSSGTNLRLTVNKMDGDLDIVDISGTVIINSFANGHRISSQMGSGSFAVTFEAQTDDTQINDIRISDSGTVTVNFKDVFLASLRVVTETGNVVYNYTDSINFVANSWINDGEHYGYDGSANPNNPYSLSDDKIVLNYDNDSDGKCYYTVGDYPQDGGTINTYTNATIYFNLLESVQDE